MSWIGRKKLALVPVYRPNAHPPDVIPPNWRDQIFARALFDPDPVTKIDRSLRAYIHTASSGLADLDAVVWDVQTVDQQDVPPGILEPQLGPKLRQQGFDAAAIVMLGGVGAGTSAGFWVRFVMVEGVGVWAMEFMHSLTGFGDLYPFGGNMGAFDEMACACGTHPSAYTKTAIGWLDSWAVVRHTAASAEYPLHAVGLVQPPPFGRTTAIRVQSGPQIPYLMIEARLHCDQFDAHIPGEGVIVYRVQTSDPLGHAQNQTAPVVLLTPAPLSVGQTFVADGGLKVQVVSALVDGFLVHVTSPDVAVPEVTELSEAIAAHTITAAGLVPKFTGVSGPHSWVFHQSPTAGTSVSVGSTVTMALRSGPLP